MAKQRDCCLHFLKKQSLFLLVIAHILFSTPSNAIEVISNSETTPHKISKQQLKAIYMGQQTHWSNGLVIKLFVLNNQDKVHQEFIQELLGIYPYQFNRRWQKLVFSGFAIKPTELQSYQEMLMVIATTPGSVGYVSEKIEKKGVNYANIY